MKPYSTEETIFSSSSKEELKNLAAKGLLSWKGKKVVLDPFSSLEFVYVIDASGENFVVRGKIGREDLSAYELFPLGALQHQIFRFWKDDFGFTEKSFTLPELKEFVETTSFPLVWNCPIPKFKPDPLPILKLKDRTGAFADLWMDYGPFGQKESGQSPEELFWEKDLLETDFIQKKMAGSNYYCPMDKVVKSLTFLLDIGWTILDAQGKKVVRQGAAALTTSMQDHIIVKGQLSYGDHQANLQNVVGAFNRREKFLNLSPSEVGLIDFPKEWVDLAEEEIVAEGIKIKRNHVGVLENIVPLPPEYQPTAWEEVPLEHFQGTLFDYQQKGLQWLSYLYRSRFSGLLADEMGLGKTVQVIAFLSTLTLTKPVLIVMPVSLLFNWKREIEKFAPRLQVILTSYAQLRVNRLHFESLDYEVVILDEAQMIKNPDSLTAQIVCRLRSPFKLAITGTPVENRYDDLWSIFRFLMPELLGERKESPIFERIRKKIRPFTLRRTKAEVALQLPEKQEQIVWVDWNEDQRAYYEQFLKEKRSTLVQKVEAGGLSAQKMEILELILRLRQLCCHPKIVSGEYTGESAKFERVWEDLEEAIASGSKVLLYSQFTSVLGLFKQRLEEKGIPFAYLDGQTKDREKAVHAFQNDPAVQVFLMSLKAGGVGLNLQAADYVFLYDPWWNTAAEQQAIDRAHRMGRKNRVIARKYLIAESIEEKILKLQMHKRTLAENILEFEGDLVPISLEDLYCLLT